MNIQDLANSISESNKSLKEKLQHQISEWKKDASTVDDLASSLTKWHGNVWFDSDEASNDYYHKLEKFKSECINNIGGMTVNERLYCFDLFDLWDQSLPEQSRIRLKLKAPA